VASFGGMFLERESALVRLDALVADALGGRGPRLVVLAGEAGIGKSTLVRELCERCHPLRVLAGACDALATPATLGTFGSTGSNGGIAAVGGPGGNGATGSAGGNGGAIANTGQLTASAVTFEFNHAGAGARAGGGGTGGAGGEANSTSGAHPGSRSPSQRPSPERAPDNRGAPPARNSRWRASL
jgi:hypothetical protein